MIQDLIKKYEKKKAEAEKMKELISEYNDREKRTYVAIIHCCESILKDLRELKGKTIAESEDTGLGFPADEPQCKQFEKCQTGRRDHLKGRECCIEWFERAKAKGLVRGKAWQSTPSNDK